MQKPVLHAPWKPLVYSTPRPPRRPTHCAPSHRPPSRLPRANLNQLYASPRAIERHRTPRRTVFDMDIAPFLFVSMVQFASMFVSLTLLPVRLAAPPYALSPTLIGVCFLPSGFGMMLGSVVGGRVSDRATEEGFASRRLVPALAGSLLLPLGCFGYGFFFQGGVHLAAPLVRRSPWGHRRAHSGTHCGRCLLPRQRAENNHPPSSCISQIAHTVLGFGQAFYMARARAVSSPAPWLEP